MIILGDDIMNTAKDIMSAIVPISRFNKGEAGKVFDEVSKEGAKIVIRNNIPTCVLLNPQEYENMIEELENYRLYVEASKRINSPDYKTISEKEVMKRLNITDKDIDEVEVEIE